MALKTALYTSGVKILITSATINCNKSPYKIKQWAIGKIDKNGDANCDTASALKDRTRKGGFSNCIDNVQRQP